MHAAKLEHLQNKLAILTSLHFGKTAGSRTVNAWHCPSTAIKDAGYGLASRASLPIAVNLQPGSGWRPSQGELAASKTTLTRKAVNRDDNPVDAAPHHQQKNNVETVRSLAERYKLRLEDERSDRAKANVLAFERLYRKVFCLQHGSDNGGMGDGIDQKSREEPMHITQARVCDAASSYGFSGMANEPTRNALEWAYDRRVDALSNRDNAKVTNGEIYRIVRYVCAPLTREALFEHTDRLIRDRYSMSYLFAYMKHLRRKYKRDFPLRGNERRAFTRSIVQRYFDDAVPKRSTDEIYASDETTYTQIKNWCLRYLFDEACTLGNHRNTRRPTLRFVYTFLLMYYTGKRMSELCMLTTAHLIKLHTDRHIALFIPKTRKLGRISYRTIDAHESAEFDAFLARAIYLFHGCLQSPYREKAVIPFDQFTHRKSLNRYFDRVYTQVTGQKKPRGLSFHSLRRRKAAVSFERGVNLDNIREILDHSSTRVTNNYINKHLVRSYRSDQCQGTVNKNTG